MDHRAGQVGTWRLQAYLASVTFADLIVWAIVLDRAGGEAHAGQHELVLFPDHGFHLGEKKTTLGETARCGKRWDSRAGHSFRRRG